MERFKENIKGRSDQNIISSVLMICFSILVISLWSGLSLDKNSVSDLKNTEKVTVLESK